MKREVRDVEPLLNCLEEEETDQVGWVVGMEAEHVFTNAGSVAIEPNWGPCLN